MRHSKKLSSFLNTLKAIWLFPGGVGSLIGSFKILSCNCNRNKNTFATVIFFFNVSFYF